MVLKIYSCYSYFYYLFIVVVFPSFIAGMIYDDIKTIIMPVLL